MIWHADEKNLEEKLMMQKSGGSLERCPWIDERRWDRVSQVDGVGPC